MHVYVNTYINMESNGILKDAPIGPVSPANMK